jgi:hypothetical protein
MRGTGDLRHHMDRHAPFDPILGPTVFQGLATIGQTCTANLAKERPEMTVVFHNLEKLQRDINLVRYMIVYVRLKSLKLEPIYNTTKNIEPLKHSD